MRHLIAAASLMWALGGCVGTVEGPDWLATAESDASYPSLREVPRTSEAVTDPRHWAAVEADLRAAREALKNHPRGQPAGAENPEAFVDSAQRELEETRQAHDPN